MSSGRRGATPSEHALASRLLRVGLLAACLLATPAPGAQAVLIASGDGTGNTTPPADDPGFDNVGILQGLSAVYLGNGWVLTAWHVGQGPVTFGGVEYPFVPGSRTRLSGPNPTAPDVGVLKIVGDPGLPALDLATTTPPVGATVVLAGNGKSRGAALTWMGLDGWQWDFPFTRRWGTNLVTFDALVVADTQSIAMQFDAPGSPTFVTDEAHAVIGDSGGATFWKSGGTWYLAGLLFLTTAETGQPAQTSLETNFSVAADVAFYRSQIQGLISSPGCSDGLDDDGDGLIDHPADPGCDDPSDPSEWSSALRCDDGLDNDGDGLIDHPNDPECSGPTAPFEAPPVPASSVWSLALLAAGLVVTALRRLPAQSSDRTR